MNVCDRFFSSIFYYQDTITIRLDVGRERTGQNGLGHMVPKITSAMERSPHQRGSSGPKVNVFIQRMLLVTVDGTGAKKEMVAGNRHLLRNINVAVIHVIQKISIKNYLQKILQMHFVKI